MFKVTLSIMLLVLLVAGCGQLTKIENLDQPPFFAPGSEIQLNRDLTIPGGHTRVFFQRGETVAKGNLDFYHPSCDLEVWELKDEARTVSKDLFIINKFTSGIQDVVSLGMMKLADISLISRVFGDGQPSVHRYLRVDLHSSAQPDVMRLTCRGAWADLPEARYPNEVEIKLALGNIFAFL